ncbi:MAG: hypothetical protein LIO95_10835 [Clostridiales bacterium]|nr:hypothetical protein [Clostridiales bacterium]
MLDGKLRIDPLLPEAWDKLGYTLLWKGQKLAVEVTKNTVTVENLTGSAPITLEVAGQEVTLTGKLTCALAQ